MTDKSLKTGILLLNLGTPDNCDIRSVRCYLTAFLNDPRVIDLPTWLRWPLVNLFIIPFRVKSSTQAYRAIWKEGGSPLLLNSLRLQKALAKKLGDAYQVALGMRYGRPSIKAALEALKDCKRLFIFPLFPQYASAVTGSVLEQVLLIISHWEYIPELIVSRDFYQNAGFISAYAHLIKKATEGKQIDLFLFSYHGLPKRQLNRKKCLPVCEGQQACPTKTVAHQDCYRAQCYATSNALANACGLSETTYMTAFQSRLGYTPWIQPYSDAILPDLIRQGIRTIAVVCPSFVSDCLETLEEVGMRMKEQWKQLGGKELVLVPCLNDEPTWVQAIISNIPHQF